MGSILYTIAVILILVWAVAWFGYSVGAMVHSLLAMAALLIILQLIRKT
ncbi:MAG TPA: lmo0937 family membrane protein [Fluviicola sp.]|nr:lmo0937 family membrane protein [Fluviicola sp.]